MKIGTLISAGVLMLSSMILNSGCSEAGNGRKQTTENPGAIFGEVKSAAGAKMLTPIALRGDKKATGHLFFELSEPAEQEVAVTFKLDSRILDAYNQLNGIRQTNCCWKTMATWLLKPVKVSLPHLHWIYCRVERKGLPMLWLYRR